MFAAVAAVAALAYWDAQREARAVFSDFADDQAWLSEVLARTLRDRLVTLEWHAREAAQGMTTPVRDLPGGLRLSLHAPTFLDPSILAFEVHDAGGATVHATISMSDALSPLGAFERADGRALIRRVGLPHLVTTSGKTVPSDAVIAGLASGGRSKLLTRGEAAALGLPARLAIAGLAHVDAGALGAWEVAAVASAQSERDRETRSKSRELLGVGVAGALVVVFGGVALRTRTNELELRHALVIQALERERDDHLVRADKLATMGALATGIAHEVSTPLGVIVARAEQIIARASGDEKIRRGGELIVAESERINAVVRGFLELARGATPRLESAKPIELVHAATNLVAHRFSKVGVVLRSNIDDEWPSVACDKRLFEQVLVNLLLNACDASRRGDLVEISVGVDDTHVCFRVTDQGNGIDAETASRATEPFFTTKTEGTGLGLAIANEIVKHHRGTLLVRPRLSSRGTEALVTLPKSPGGTFGNAGT